MSTRAQGIQAGRARAESGTGFLYGWLLVSLFIEYARPTNQLTFLDFPYFYAIVPMTLLVVSSFAPGLRPMKEIFSDRMAKWVPIFFGVVALSWAATGFNTGGVPVFQMVLENAFRFFLIARIVTTEKRLRGVIISLVLAHFYLLAVNFNVLVDPSVRQYLVGGTFLGDGNDYSLSMCILIPCMVEVALSSESKFRRYFAWISVAVIILAIVASQSRGGTLGVVAVFIYLWLRSPNKLITAFAIALVGALVLLYAPAQYYQRIGTVTGMTIDGSAQGRLDAWSGAIGMGAKNPVLGIGAGQFSVRWGKTAHSTYMLAFGELGLPGLICVLVLVFGNLRMNAKLRKRLLARAGPNPAPDAWRTIRQLDLVNAALVGFAVCGAFLSATYYPHMYVLTALLISARIFAMRAVSLPPDPGVVSGQSGFQRPGRRVLRNGTRRD